ncbi:MAG: hypothetical protein K8U57_21410 [Planctomycetes bacterium]|nr:hypothetical protein [Planctomycetota bacterium]
MCGPTNDDRSEPLLPLIDLTWVTFPSNSLSVAILRRRFPTDFDEHFLPVQTCGPFFGDVGFRKEWHDHLSELFASERLVAIGLFHHVRGDMEPFAEGENDDVIAARGKVESLYPWFGLCDGPETARVLIDRIERQAIALARGSSSPER